MAPVVFDRSAALSRMGGDEQLFREMVDYFLTDSADLRIKLRQAIDQRDGPEVERTAHVLKGLASNFGAARTQRAAFIVENLGHGGDFGGAAVALTELEEALDQLCAALRAA